MTELLPRNRRPWLFGSLLAAMGGVVSLAYVFLLERPVGDEKVEPAVAVAQPVPVVLKISQVEGAVEVRHGEGQWRPAQTNMSLEASDGVRTMDGATAVLSGGDAYDVRLSAGTSVSVDMLTESISRLLLDNGLATARVRGGARRHAFEVKSLSGDAVARSKAGVFTMSSNGVGTVAVGTQEGEVEFSGGGKWVVVRAGQQSVVQKGSAPTAPSVVPSSLLLKVQWPTAGLLRQRSVVLQGKTEPGAWVDVGGAVAPVDAQGNFSKQVRLKEGANEIRVQSRGVGGGVQQQSEKVRVDTTPPKVGIDRDLWRE